jgi:hypothetical protein
MWNLFHQIFPIIVAVLGTLVIPALRRSGKYDQTRQWLILASGILQELLAQFPAAPTQANLLQLSRDLTVRLVARGVPTQDAPGVAATALHTAGFKPLDSVKFSAR